MRDFLPTFPKISVMEVNSSSSTILYLSLELSYFHQANSLTVIKALPDVQQAQGVKDQET